MGYKLFFRNLLIVLLLSILFTGTMFLSIKPDPNSFFQGSVLKLNLLKTTPSPKIVLVGGSNIAFGIDSSLIHEAFGIPVINDGLYAGLSLLPFEELKQFIGPGDIIIASIEYINFTFITGNPQEIADWIEYAPERLNYLSNPLAQIPSTFNITLQRKFTRQLNYYLYNKSLEEIRGIYQGNNFNQYGDFTGHLAPGAEPPDLKDSPYPVNPSMEITDYLIHFREFAFSKGAIVYFEAQANRQTNCEATPEKRLVKFYRDLENETGIPVLTNMDELCLPDKYFFDTEYHLNAEGREIRTKRLIENLSAALNNQQPLP